MRYDNQLWLCTVAVGGRNWVTGRDRPSGAEVHEFPMHTHHRPGIVQDEQRCRCAGSALDNSLYDWISHASGTMRSCRYLFRLVRARLDNAQPGGKQKEGNLGCYVNNSDFETLIGCFKTSCVTITEYAMLIRTGYHILMIGLVGRAAHFPHTHPRHI